MRLLCAYRTKQGRYKNAERLHRRRLRSFDPAAERKTSCSRAGSPILRSSFANSIGSRRRRPPRGTRLLFSSDSPVGTQVLSRFMLQISAANPNELPNYSWQRVVTDLLLAGGRCRRSVYFYSSTTSIALMHA